MTPREDTTQALPVNHGSCPFDPLSADLARAPHEVYAQLRERCPVARSDRWEGFVVLTRYADVVKAATKPALFSSTEGIVVPRNPVSGRRAPMHFDPPEHTRYRRAMNAVFRDDRVAAMEPDVRAAAVRLLDPLVQSGHRWDVVEDFSSPYTCDVLARLLSLDGDVSRALNEHTRIFERAQVDEDAATAEAENMVLYAMAREIVAQRQAAPLDPDSDLITRMLRLATDQDDPAEFVAGSVRQLFVAGHVAPTVAIAAIVLALATDAELQDRLRAEPELIPDAVEELLRLHTPNQGFSRTVTTSTTLHGEPVRAGERVVLSYPSANRDPAVFEDPDRFVLERRPHRHLAFGSGVHKCVGATLARAELRIAVEELLSRTQRLQLAGEPAPFPWPMLGPASVPVTTVARR